MAAAEASRELTPPSASGGYVEHAATGALQPFVECYWTRGPDPVDDDWSAPPVHRVLPDGCMDVVLEFMPGRDAAHTSAMAVGTMTRALVVRAGEPRAFVGVRFRPGKAAAFLRLPASELTDLSVPLDDLWADAAAVRDTLGMAGDAASRVKALERALLARITTAAAAGDQRDVDEAVRRIVAAGGSLGIMRLAPALGVTRQHLARRFAQLVGVSPKTFARVVRLRRLVERVDAMRGAPGVATAVARMNWSALALDLGYYDQPHLVDEFREMTGLTPVAWARERVPGRGPNAAPVPFSQDDTRPAR